MHVNVNGNDTWQIRPHLFNLPFPFRYKDTTLPVVGHCSVKLLESIVFMGSIATEFLEKMFKNVKSNTCLVAVKTTGLRHLLLVRELLMSLNLPVGNDIGFRMTTPVEINKPLRYPLHKYTLTKTTNLRTCHFIRPKTGTKFWQLWR